MWYASWLAYSVTFTDAKFELTFWISIKEILGSFYKKHQTKLAKSTYD